jgi:hypothetical protein
MHLTYRNENGMLRRALVLKPFTETADSGTGCLSNARISILKTRLDDGPDFAHQRSHIFTASLNGNTKGKNSTPSQAGVGRSEILYNECSESREDLGWRQICGKSIDDTESRLSIADMK